MRLSLWELDVYANCNILHGGKYTDALVIYRAFRKDLIYQLDLHRGDARTTRAFVRNDHKLEPLMSVRASKAGKKVSELPAGEPLRIGGERKSSLQGRGFPIPVCPGVMVLA